MDFFQRLGNFFTGKGWINDDEKRRKEQQSQPVQQQPVQQSTVQQPAWIRQNAQTPTISQPTAPKANTNPLQQANQATQQLNLNSQNNQLKPQVTANDAPKVLTPQGQQDWANQQNKQIQAHNMAVQPPKPQPAQQPVQQPRQVQPKPVLQQKPQPQLASPSVSSSQNLLTRSGIEPNPTYLAIKRANEEVNQYKADQARRQDALDETMRARGIGEPEIAKSRQTRIQMENEAREAAYEAQKARNIASVANIATAPGRATASFVKGVVGGAGRSIGDTGDKLALAISDAMYGITGDERYNRGRQRILEQGKQRNEQYDKQFGVFNKNDADVDIAYELGEGGQRLAQDMGTAVVTGGTVPVARAFAENAADFVTDANAHGKNTRDVLPAAYANATAQSAIEKIGLDKVLTPGGKTAAVRMLKGALAEGGEEAAQQLVGNAFAKHTYDPNRKYSEGVVKSALMGAALGGPAGAGNFGGVRQTSVQPSVDTSTQVAQNQQVQSQQSSNAQPAENTSLRQAAEVSAVNTQTNQAHPIQQVNVNQTVETTMPNASPALKQAVSQNISDIQRGDTSAIATRQQTAGKLENYLVEQATQSVQNMVAADVRYKLDDQPSIDHTAEIQAYNDHLGRLRQQESNLLAQGLSENSAPVINNRKAQAEAVYARNHVGEMSDDGVRYQVGDTNQDAMFYRGQEKPGKGIQYNSTRFANQNVGGGVFFTDNMDTAKKYGDNIISTERNDTNTVSTAESDKLQAMAEAKIEEINRNPRLINTISEQEYDLLEQMALGRPKAFAEYTNKPFVETGDKFGEPGEAIYYKEIDDRNDTVRFKQRAEAQVAQFNDSLNELKARHLDLTGDEKLVFNEWQNEMQRKALGYYDPKTDKIDLNRLSEDTLNHELGHKLLERADNKQELLTAIRRFYGDNYLINKYGQQYGTTDINLLAEEQLADGFSEYYNGKLNGENTQRLAARLHIPQRIVAIYDRITEAIRGLIGKQDIIKQFYAQMETGKFRNTQQQTPGGDGRVRTMSLDSDVSERAVRSFNSVRRGKQIKSVVGQLSEDGARKVAEALRSTDFNKKARLIIDKNAVNHLRNSGHLTGLGRNGADANPLTEADIRALPHVFSDPDIVYTSGTGRTGKRMVFERQLDNHHRIVAELEYSGKDFNLVTYFNINKDLPNDKPAMSYSPEGVVAADESGRQPSRPGRSSSDPDNGFNDSIPNVPQNVNNDLRFKHPLQDQIDDIQNNPKPKMTKELRQAIDEEIYNYYPELFVSEAADLQSTNGDWNIPRLHVDDLKHYLGELANDIPSRYKRLDGKRDIDTVAQEMGYDDIDSFINEIHRVLEARRNARASKQRLAELRRDPDIIADAQQALAAKNSSNTQTTQSQQSPDEQLKETVQNQPLEQQGFKNIPLEDNHLLTKGNLYEQTKPGIRDDWTRPFQDGDYEYRLHTKRSRDGKKSFNSFERRYVGDNGEYGDWMPTSRAAYIWKSQTKDIGKVNRNEAIQKALEAAEQDGEVQEFMAYKNPGRDGGVMVMPLTGEHSIDGGFVRNPKTGEIEGNYIQVTPFGVVHQTNGKFDVVEVDRLTNALGKSKGSVFDNFNRLIEKNINDEEGQKVLKDLYYQKTEAYAKYADTLNSLFAKHNAVADLLDKSRGKFTSSKRFWEDVGRYTEGIFPTSGPNETMNEAFARKYGTQAAERVKTYDAFMRENYDAMIKNLNAIRRMYGKEEIPYLENYMPHIQKRSGLLGRAADRLLTALPTGIRGDIEGQSRGEIPASIAGLSADFKPGHKFNPNEKHRHGSMMDYEKDPRKAFEHYADLMLYNTHMEPVIARGRQIESSMRATDMAKKSGTFIDPDSNLAQGDTVSNKATIAVQDFVNEMAGKSSSLDRPFIDRANKHIQFIQRLESVNGANKILGNLSSTLAQTLNLPETVRDNGVINTGHAFLTAFDKTTKQAMRKSPFLRERYTDTDGKFTRSGYQKVTDKISVVSGMNLVEKKFIQLNWAANYYRFQKQGLTGYQLIKAADQATERAVGGRGIGAMPQAYKSTLGKMFLQFTYETNESWKNNISHVKKIGSDIKQLQFKDAGSGAVRAAEAFAVAYGMNMLMKQVTGDEPLANMVDAVKDVLSNDADDDGEDDKLGQKIARIGSEASKMNPVASAAFNLVPKSEREKIFGKSSDLGRFDGATGVAQTAANALGAGFYAAQGDSENAQKNLQGLIPAGGQLKKTMGGAKVLQEGGDVYIDKNGKERTNFEVDSGNTWNQAKALLFGKNAVRPDEKSAAASSSNGDASRTVRDFERGLKKGTYKVQDDLVVNKKGDVQRSYYKALAEGQGESDEAYSNWMKAYNIDDASTLKKEFNSSNDILNKLENGEKKANKAKSAVDILMGKHKDLPDWVKERYYKESGYSKDQIEYGAMTTHKEVSLMDNYWRQKAQESSHEELMQALINGRRKSITGQMFAKNGVINKLRAEGYITKWEAKALNAAQFDVDGNRITKEMSGGGNGRSGSGRSSGGRASSSPLISAAVKNINSLTSAAPKANQTSVKGVNINQIGQNLINRSVTQRQVNATLKQWNSTSKKNSKIHIKKARA